MVIPYLALYLFIFLIDSWDIIFDTHCLHILYFSELFNFEPIVYLFVHSSELFNLSQLRAGSSFFIYHRKLLHEYSILLLLKIKLLQYLALPLEYQVFLAMSYV